MEVNVAIATKKNTLKSFDVMLEYQENPLSASTFDVIQAVDTCIV